MWETKLSTRHTEDTGFDVAKALRKTARRLKTSSTGLMIAAAVVYLHRTSGERDVTVGLTVRGRLEKRDLKIPGITGPRGLAYVMFTSGTTGRPKAVGVSQGALASYADAVASRAGFGAGQRFALLQAMGTDLGITMVAGALACGGELHGMIRLPAIRREKCPEPHDPLPLVSRTAVSS